MPQGIKSTDAASSAITRSDIPIQHKPVYKPIPRKQVRSSLPTVSTDFASYIHPENCPNLTEDIRLLLLNYTQPLRDEIAKSNLQHDSLEEQNNHLKQNNHNLEAQNNYLKTQNSYLLEHISYLNARDKQLNHFISTQFSNTYHFLRYIQNSNAKKNVPPQRAETIPLIPQEFAQQPSSEQPSFHTKP